MAWKPRGAYYILTDVAHFLKRYDCRDDHEFAMFLIKEIGVATVPGSSFYAHPRARPDQDPLLLPQDGRHADRGGAAAPEARALSLREAARAIFDAALAAGDVAPAGRAALWPTSRAGRRGRVLVVGAGKASGAMAAAAEEALGDRIADGLVVVKDGYLAPIAPGRAWSKPGIPVPDERGAAAARARSATLAESAGADDLVLVLISGGGSALTPAPAPPITLADKQAVTRLLLAAGATINQLNAVRKHCSLLKGGQLARAAAPARVHALLLSDVIGDPLDVIASGPTAPDASTFADALAILDRFELRARAPAGDRRAARAWSPRARSRRRRSRGIRCSRGVTNIGDRQQRAGRRGGGRAGARARLRAARAHPRARGRGARGGADLRRPGARDPAGRGPVAPPACLIAGGETTVTVRGTGQRRALPGVRARRGARARRPSTASWSSPPAPTAPTGRPTPRGRSSTARSARARARARRRSAGHAGATTTRIRVLAALGDLVVTGPTNTNLLDLYLLLVEGR